MYFGMYSHSNVSIILKLDSLATMIEYKQFLVGESLPLYHGKRCTPNSNLSQLTLWRECEGKIDKPKQPSPREKMSGVATNVYSRKMLEKPKRGLQILKRRVRELFTHGEGISTPHACHKGQQPLIEWHNMTSRLFIFPFYIFCVFSLFIYIYFIFFGSTRVFPCSYVFSGAMRNLDLDSSLSLKVRVLHWFYVFWKIDSNCEQKSLKALDLETIF